MIRMSKSRVLIYGILLFLILLPYAGVFGLRVWYRHRLNEINNAAFIVISKEEMSLRLIDYKGHELYNYPIACGKNFGNKEKKGDLRTPEGLFHITEIEKASEWTHDFGDGQGEITGAYGPFFIRLEVPGHKGIGIHGTHKPESIGTRDTEGCIRLLNENLEQLVEKCHIGMAVFITPSYSDILKSGRADSLKLSIVEHDKSILPANKGGSRSPDRKADSGNKPSRTDRIKLK